MPVSTSYGSSGVAGRPEHQRVNAPPIPAAEPSRLDSEPQKPQLTVARKTSRAMTFESKNNDVTVLDTEMAI